MGRGSLLCAKLCERIVSQLKVNVSQHKIAKNLGLSPSTVHNIVKWFRESGEVSVHKGQGQKPLLNARDSGGIVWETVMILSCHCIKKCNLKMYYAETPPSSLGPESSEMDWKTVETCSLVRRVHISACFWEKQMSDSMYKIHPETIQTVTNEKCKNQSLWWYGGESVPMAWVICIHVKVPLMQRLMLEFWRDICCCQDVYFSQELHVFLQQRGFVGIECVCLTGLPAVKICLLLKMYGPLVCNSSELCGCSFKTCNNLKLSVFLLFMFLYIYYFSSSAQYQLLSVLHIPRFCQFLHSFSPIMSVCSCEIWAWACPESVSSLFGHFRNSGIF